MIGKWSSSELEDMTFNIWPSLYRLVRNRGIVCGWNLTNVQWEPSVSLQMMSGSSPLTSMIWSNWPLRQIITDYDLIQQLPFNTDLWVKSILERNGVIELLMSAASSKLGSVGATSCGGETWGSLEAGCGDAGWPGVETDSVGDESSGGELRASLSVWVRWYSESEIPSFWRMTLK